MPNILFASNNIAHWPTALAGSVPGTFDPARVPYSIAMSNWESLNSPKFIPSQNGETWFHFNVYSNTHDFHGQKMFFQCIDANGMNLLRITKLNGVEERRLIVTLYDGNTSITGNTSVYITNSKLSFVDILYSVNDLKIECKVYINGIIGLTLLLNANPNSFQPPVAFSIGTAFAQTISDKQHISEIIVADGDTRNARLNLLRPVAAGAHDAWEGNLASLADDDPTTGMTTIAPNERQTVKLSPYTGAPNISNFVIVSQTTRGENSPTGLKHSIRLSTVDYDSPLIPVDFPLQYNLTDYNVNPATSLPWKGSDLSLIETGFVSVA